MADADSDDENFIAFGTPLPFQEEDEIIKRKPVLVQDQVVKDEKGRRRFHGAFTGGFSAGYFNSVGSEEGWAPNAFLSSRSAKNEKVQQKPEDFMDEEDFSAHGIAPKKIVTTEHFSSSKNERKRSLDTAAHHAIPGKDILTELIQPVVHDSIGVILLKKLGWKPGQGIGPRVKRKRKRHLKCSGEKVYSCALPQPEGDFEANLNESDDDEGDELAKKFLFAPTDIEVFLFNPKDNFHGLGYRGLDPKQVLADGFISSFSSEGKLSKGVAGMRGQAFGIGAFEDEDEDIYSHEDMSEYDHILGDTKKPDKNFGWTAPKIVNELDSKNNFTSFVLPGFCKCSQPLAPSKLYNPPSLPSNYKLVHIFKNSIQVKEVLPKNDTVKLPVNVENKCLKESTKPFQHNAQTRAVILEEKPPVSTPIFDLLKDSDKIYLMTVKAGLSYAGSKPPKSSLTSNEEVCKQGIPLVTGAVSFKPFARDPAKQQRYEAYLAATNAKKKDPLEDIPLGHMTEWERTREKEEFQRAVSLYRPLSASIASRFTSAKYDESTEQVDVSLQEGGDLTEQEKAASMKMFGKLTRDIFEWHPNTLLCRRFNVPNPYPDSTLVGLPKVKKEKVSLFNFLNIPEEPKAIEAATQPSSSDREKKQNLNLKTFIEKEDSKNIPVEQVLPSIASEPKDVEEEESRPPMDLFKAIFQNTDSEDSSESDENEPSVETVVDQKINPSPTVVKSVQPKENPLKSTSSKSSAEEFVKSLFDIDSETNISTKPLFEDSSAVSKSELNVCDSEGAVMYGPKLPPPKNSSSSDNAEIPFSSQPTSQMKHKHKHKHSKKTKSKKSKHKKKHLKDSGIKNDLISDLDNSNKERKKSSKKKKCKIKHRSSSTIQDSDSSASGTDSPSSDTDEKLKQRLKSLQRASQYF